MSFSIDAWPLDAIEDRDFATLCKIDLRKVQAARAQRRKSLADPAWVARAVDQLPAATIALLAAVAGGGGIVSRDELIRSTTRLDARRIAAALVPAFEQLLAVPLASREGELVALVAPAATHLRTLLADFDVPVIGDAPFEDTPSDDRIVLAVCLALQHVEGKLTAEGRLHRSHAKRLAKQVGLEEAAIDHHVEIALAAGLLAVDEQHVIRPDLEALEAAAAGRYLRSAALQAIATRLDAGPASVAAIRSWASRSGARVLVDRLATLPGFGVGMIGGHPALRRVPPRGEPKRAHVTPNFEVFFPPEALAVDVVRLGALCEPGRIDRMIVGRITKLSIARAAVAAPPDQLLAVLRGACRTEIPQNVEAAICDWASVRSAMIARGQVIAVAAEQAEATRRALATLAPRELVAGVFVVSEHVPRRTINDLLAAGSISVAAPPATSKIESLPRLVPLSDGAPTRLRLRVEAWRRGEAFEGVRDEVLDRADSPAVPPLRTERPTPCPDCGRVHELGEPELDDDDAHDLEILLARAEREGMRSLEIARQLGRWERRHARIPVLEKRVLEHVLAVAAPAVIREVFEAVDVWGLLDRCDMLIRDGLGRELLDALSDDGDGDEDQAELVLQWQTGDLRTRLQAVARANQPVILRLTSGTPKLAEISSVVQRGSTWMVLGECLDSDVSIAIPLSTITAIATASPQTAPGQTAPSPAARGQTAPSPATPLPPPAAPAAARSSPNARWRPHAGEQPPAGHVSCPCGSGERYRNCCRPQTQA